MHHRRPGSRPTFALWTLIAAANLAAIVAGIGVLTALVIAGALGLVAAAATVVWLLARPSEPSAKPVPAPRSAPVAAPMVARREA